MPTPLDVRLPSPGSTGEAVRGEGFRTFHVYRGRSPHVQFRATLPLCSDIRHDARNSAPANPYWRRSNGSDRKTETDNPHRILHLLRLSATSRRSGGEPAARLSRSASRGHHRTRSVRVVRSLPEPQEDLFEARARPLSRSKRGRRAHRGIARGIGFCRSEAGCVMPSLRPRQPIGRFLPYSPGEPPDTLDTCSMQVLHDRRRLVVTGRARDQIRIS
jgi:hypothetical protein